MIEFIANRCVEFEPVGSSVTCDPPVMDTDRDYLCLLEVGSNAGAIYDFLHDNEYVNESTIEVEVTATPDAAPTVRTVTAVEREFQWARRADQMDRDNRAQQAQVVQEGLGAQDDNGGFIQWNPRDRLGLLDTATVRVPRYPEAVHDARGPDGGFESWRKGNINLIITYNRLFFDKFMAASDVCRKLNLLRKEDRIMVFEAVRNLKRHP